jgi:hypothetical protein
MARLQQHQRQGAYPSWDIWFVGCYQAPATWAAKPKGCPVATINANSPEELIEAIGRRGQGHGAWEPLAPGGCRE